MRRETAVTQWKKVLRVLCIFWIGVLGWHSAHAESVLLENYIYKQSIGLGIDYLEDPTGNLTARELLSGTRDWQRSSDEIFNQGYNGSVWWLRFSLVNNSDHADWLMEIAYPVLDYLDIYLVRDSNIVQHLALGDKLAFPERPVEHRHFVVPLQLTADTPTEVLIRVRSTSSVQVPIVIWDKVLFYSEDASRTMIQGLYYGAMLIIAIYNVLLYLALGERTYLYYVAYVSFIALFIASLDGWTFQYLWPTQTQWNDQAIIVALALGLAFGVVFTQRFLEIPLLSNSQRLIQNAWIVLCGLILCAAFSVPYSIMIRILVPLATVICIHCLCMGIYAWRKGSLTARYYTLAWSLLLVGGITLALSKFHLLPRNFFTDYNLQAGTLLEVVLLSFALAERINHERAMRYKAQQQALDTQLRATEVLEQRVNERTRELEVANQKLQEISDTDQLTGIKNRRYLDHYLHQEIARAARYRHPLAVILIDVDHFKPVNDTHGHLVGDDCLQEIARRIGAQSRWPSDLAARFGGEEFCVVLPETDGEGARIVAERVRQQVEAAPIKTRQGPLNLTISLGVFCMVPTNRVDVPDFLAKADLALYQSKEQGRNRVTVHESGAQEPPTGMIGIPA